MVIAQFISESASLPVTPVLPAVPVGKRYKILNIVAANRTAVSHNFALFVSPGGGAPVDDRGCFIPDFVLAGKQNYVVPNGEGMELEAGDELYARASTTGVISLIISYHVLNAA